MYKLYKYDPFDGKMKIVTTSKNKQTLIGIAIRNPGEFRITEVVDREVWNNFKDKKDKP